MRIAYDFQAFSQHYGGVALYFSKLATHINSALDNARIFAPFFQNRYVHSLPVEMVEGKFLAQYPYKSKRIIWKLNQLLSSSKISAWHPDIYHQTYYQFNPPSFGETARIVTIYDMTHELFSESFLPNDPTPNLKRKAIEHADHVICISESTRNDLIRLVGIDKKKTSCIYLGVDPVMHKFEYPLIFNQSAKPYLLYVGTRMGYKNFLGLLRAYASSEKLKKDFNLLIVGGGRLTKNEKQAILNLNLLPEQVLTIDADATQINAFYRHASAFIYPSLYEGFGLPPLEAMTNGCPVVVSNAASMPEVIGTAGEYFDPNSTEELAFAIEQVVYSDTRSQELRLLGYQQASLFTWDRCAKETLNLYKELI